MLIASDWGDDWVKILTCAFAGIAMLFGIVSPIITNWLSAKRNEETKKQTESAAVLVAQTTKAATDAAAQKTIDVIGRKTDLQTQVFAAKTDEQTEAITSQTEEIKAKTTAVHELVNGKMTRALNDNAKLAKELADVRGTEEDIAKAKLAAEQLRAHIARNEGQSVREEKK